MRNWLSPSYWLTCAAIVAGLVLAYFAWADHIGDKREAQVVERYAKQAKTIDAKREAISKPVAAKEAKKQVEIRTVFQTITKEVPTYVSINDCPMSPGFRVFHDAAANAVLPDPADIPNAAAVPADHVANTLADNYEICHQTSARLTGLQDWIKAQQGATK